MRTIVARRYGDILSMARRACDQTTLYTVLPSHHSGIKDRAK
jgi:hypothetical protein